MFENTSPSDLHAYGASSGGAQLNAPPAPLGAGNAADVDRAVRGGLDASPVVPRAADYGTEQTYLVFMRKVA